MRGFGQVDTSGADAIDLATLLPGTPSIPEIVNPATGEPYLTLQDVQNAINSGFQSTQQAVNPSWTQITTWLSQNSTIVYATAVTFFVLALFGGGKRR